MQPRHCALSNHVRPLQHKGAADYCKDRCVSITFKSAQTERLNANWTCPILKKKNLQSRKKNLLQSYKVLFQVTQKGKHLSTRFKENTLITFAGHSTQQTVIWHGEVSRRSILMWSYEKKNDAASFWNPKIIWRATSRREVGVARFIQELWQILTLQILEKRQTAGSDGSNETSQHKRWQLRWR